MFISPQPRNLIYRRLTALTILFALSAGALAAIDSRQPAPAFSARTMDGEKLTNDSLKGKVVLLQFWTTWCGYCRRDEAAVNTLAKQLEGKGLVTLAVNVGESKKKVKTYLEGSPRSGKIALTEDTNLAAVFAAQSFPLYVVIDRDGRIAGTQEGAGGEGSLRRLLSKAGIE